MLVTIQRINESELSTLVDFSRSTFYDGFAHQNTQSDIELYLNTAFNESTLGAELKDELNEFYFLYADGVVAGYIKLSFALSVDAPVHVRSFELCRLYIAKAFQNRSLGQRMINFCFELGKNRGYEAIWLGVWEHNHGAMKLYLRNGFELYGSHDFLLGTDVQTDLLMMKSL